MVRMNLRDLLERCTADNMDDWVEIPGSRPATLMLAAMFDPGAEDSRTRALFGHSIAVFEPDPRLTMVWPVPEDDEDFLRLGRRGELPEFAEQDSQEWKSASPSWVVILFNGSPVWQALLWYLEWGAGIGGYVANFQPVFDEDDDEGAPTRTGWETTTWAIGLAGLVNSMSNTYQWHSFDPSARLVPKPSTLNPVDAQRTDQR